jgi:hypothetical protein
MNRHLRFCLFLSASATASAAHGQAPSVDRVARFVDGRGIVVRYAEELATGRTPIDLARFRLVDLAAGEVVPIEQTSTFSQEACSYPEALSDRICIQLRSGAPSLDPQGRYALLTDTVRLIGSKTLPPAIVPIEPVAGAVQKLTREGGRRILAHYSVDLGNDTEIDPRVLVNRRPVTILTPRRGDAPLCYRRSDYAFDCEIAHRLRPGDTVAVHLVSRTTGTVIDSTRISSAAVDVTVVTKREESQIYGNWAYSRQDGSDKGSITIGVQNLVATQFGATADRYQLTLGPYADLLVTTEAKKGRITFGPQARLRVRPFLGMDLADFRYTPRWDTDTDFRLGQFAYLDAEARLYLPFVHAGEFLGGPFSLVPRVGIERATTIHGPDTARVEVNSPMRLKWGANGSVFWPTDVLRAAPAGLKLEADVLFRTVDVRDAPLRQVPSTALYWTAQLSVGITPNVSLTVTRRSGRTPPLFVHQSALEFGAVFIQ